MTESTESRLFSKKRRAASGRREERASGRGVGKDVVNGIAAWTWGAKRIRTFHRMGTREKRKVVLARVSSWAMRSCPHGR